MEQFERVSFKLLKLFQLYCNFLCFQIVYSDDGSSPYKTELK